MKSVFLAAALALSSTPAFAWFSDTANSNSIGRVSVEFLDGAKDACWTNLREAREYAEEKLRSKGYTSENGGTPYTFHINVHGYRMNNGTCVGNVEIQIYSPRMIDGVFGVHEIGSTSYTANNNENINKTVINAIFTMIDEMN